MIARPDQCDPAQLALMLGDQLDIDVQTRVTQHLDHCEDCQAELEKLAAEQNWWNDTRSALSDEVDPELSDSSIFANPNTPHAETREAGSATELPSDDPHWVMKLLGESDDPQAIGSVDTIPIFSVIGQGGMGVVLKGRDNSLHRSLAIKLLSPMLSSSGAARQRFLREAQAAASVVHPNIVPIYAVSAERELPYLVMPFVGGGNLQQYLDRHGQLSIDRVLSIGLQVAEGLIAAHGQGIVHRDIKPANLMLDEGGFRIMLTDFGLARALDDATLTASGMVAGTPQFMSPEQALGKSVDHRSDIYSLGAVMYALATGRPPVRGDSTLDVLRRIGEEAPKPIIEVNETYPRWFQSLVNMLLNKNIEERLQSAEQVALLLRECLAHVRSPHQCPLPKELLIRRKWTLFRTKHFEIGSRFNSAPSSSFAANLASHGREVESGRAVLPKRLLPQSFAVRMRQRVFLAFAAALTLLTGAWSASLWMTDNSEHSVPTDMVQAGNSASAPLTTGPDIAPSNMPLPNSTPPINLPRSFDRATSWETSDIERRLSRAEEELRQLQLDLGSRTSASDVW